MNRYAAIGSGRNCWCWAVLIASLLVIVVMSMSSKRWEWHSSAQTQLSAAPQRTFANNQLTLVPHAEIELNTQMTPLEIDAMFYMFISRQHYICKNTIRLGNAADGGWTACLAGPYRPSKPCLVYSFGINNDWSFDDDVVMNFGCIVRSFDPSMTDVNEHVRGSNIHFFRIGIGGKDYENKKKWQLRTLPTIVSTMNDTGKVIDYLKFDIESAEYEVIRSFLNSSVATELLRSKVKQVGFEVHIAARTPNAAVVNELYNAWNLLAQFESRLGFRRWYFGVNPFHIYDVSHGIKRSCCYEVVYINTQFLQ